LAAGGGGVGVTAGAKALAAAHARLLNDHATQFAFTALPSDPKLELPWWLKILGQWIGAAAKFIAPFAIDLFWIGLAAAILAAVFLIAREVMGAHWRPEAFKARALLEDADRLAAQGRYDEATHLLLLRGIDDIEDKRPRLVKPALTARDIAVLAAVPAAARDAFAVIAAVVEKSLFGGRRLDANAFAQCRAAYEAFAFPKAWT
jgi:hypothetical protein